MENSLTTLLESIPTQDGDPITQLRDLNLPLATASRSQEPALRVAQLDGHARHRRRCLACDWYDIGVGAVLLTSAATAVYSLLWMTQP